MKTLTKLYESSKPEPLYLDQFGNYLFRMGKKEIQISGVAGLISSLGYSNQKGYFLRDEYKNKFPSKLDSAKEYAFEHYIDKGNDGKLRIKPQYQNLKYDAAIRDANRVW